MYINKAHEEQPDFPSAERFNYLLDVLNNGSGTTEETIKHIETKYNDQERYDEFFIFLIPLTHCHRVTILCVVSLISFKSVHLVNSSTMLIA